MRVPALRIAVVFAVAQLCLWSSAVASGPNGGVSSENDVKTYDLMQHDVEEAEVTHKNAVAQRDGAHDQVKAAESARSNATEVAERAKMIAKAADFSLKAASSAEKDAMGATGAAEKRLRRVSEDVSSAEAELKRLITALADKRSAASAAGLAFGNKQAERDQQKQALDVLQGLNDKYACAKSTETNVPFCDQLKEQIQNAKNQGEKLDGALEPLQKAKDTTDEEVKAALANVEQATNNTKSLVDTRKTAEIELENASEKLEKAKASTTELKDELIEAKNRVAEATRELAAAEMRLAEATAYHASSVKLAVTAEKHRNETLNAVKAMEKIAKATLANLCSDALQHCASNTTTPCHILVDNWAEETSGWFKIAPPEWTRLVDDCPDANSATTMGVALTLLALAVSLTFA